MQKQAFYTYKRKGAFLWNAMFSKVSIMVYLTYLGDVIVDIGDSNLFINLHIGRYGQNGRFGVSRCVV